MSKGWRGHSREHSLAAHGIQTKASGMVADFYKADRRFWGPAKDVMDSAMLRKEKELDYAWEIGLDEVMDLRNEAEEQKEKWLEFTDEARKRNDKKGVGYGYLQYVNHFAAEAVLEFIYLERIGIAQERISAT